MTKLIIRTNSLDTSNDEVCEVVDVCEYLCNRFEIWPRTAKLYRDFINSFNEIQLSTKADIDNLRKLKGTIYVVVYPAGIGLLGAALIGATAAIVHWPKGKKNKGNQAATATDLEIPSPNNSVTTRTNSSRLYDRIPDIYGTVVSTPDLIAEPYTVYEGNRETEYSYMCVGRGDHTLSEFKDGNYNIEGYSWTSIEVYGPNTSPNSGSPKLTVSTPITRPLITTKRSLVFQGIVLTPFPNVTTPAGGEIVEGDFFIINLSADKIEDNPTLGSRVINIRLIFQSVDSNDDLIGSAEIIDYAINDPGDTGGQINRTFEITPVLTGRLMFNCFRQSDYTAITTDPGDPGGDPPVPPTVEEKIDTVTVTSFFSCEEITTSHFGNITTAYVRTYGSNSGRLQTGGRFNCRASRLIPVYNTETQLFSSPAETSRFADIVVAITIDPFIGNRDISELDLDSLYAAQEDIENYFGSSKAIEFNHTFDQANQSFEDTLAIVCEAVFVTAYRQGKMIKFSFEKLTSTARLVFNHRNKIPGTESRTISFGRLDDKDGVEVEWFSNVDGVKEIIRLPEDLSSVNPEKITLLGITNRLQAYFHAWRLWNQIQYQNCAIEFDATQEASILNLNDRVIIADNTRQNTYDGEVIAQSGLTLTLSQDFEFESGKSYTIFIQNVNATVQAIAISAGLAKNQVVLASPTSLPLPTDDDFYARATYEIVENSSTRQMAFLIDEKSPQDNFITTIRAINYDDRYYSNDKDFINSVVDENGN